MDRIHDTRRWTAHRRPPRRQRAAGSPAARRAGLGFDYLRDLADELAQENDVAWYQQRGLSPCAAEGPYSVGTDVDDAGGVLDTLGWDKAWVVGHSWGGHLALHVAEAFPEHLFGALAVDPAQVGGRDGRWPEFDEEICRRTPAEVHKRARELDALRKRATADDELALEMMLSSGPRTSRIRSKRRRCRS